MLQTTAQTRPLPCFEASMLCFEACGVRARSLSGLAIEVGLDSGPVLIAPGLFGLGDQVLRNAAMRQHELRPTICCWRQRDRGHREDALGECAVAPGLNDAPSGDEVDID